MSKKMSNQQPISKDKSDKKATETKKFDYESTFKVNYGIFSRGEQERIREARVTIVGVGGVGGPMSTILARSGVANFILVDPDVYTETNINRQVGAFVDTLGKYKVEVAKEEILRINPEAKVEVYTRKLSFDELGKLIDKSDVFIPTADDFAYSNIAVMMAEERKKFTIGFIPCGLAGYIMVFPPDLPRIFDPIDLFGGPKNLSYEDLYHFLADPFNKMARKFYITEGKWRIGWFKKWRMNEIIFLPISKWCFNYNIWEGESLKCAGMVDEQPLVPIAQLCPPVWLGSSLASMEVLKYLTGKWKLSRAPKMWHLMLAENRIKVERFRRRTWLFLKIMAWALNIKWLGIGERIRNNTVKQIEKELAEMEKQEEEGKQVKPPFLWRHII